MDDRIAGLKHDLGADGFCLKEFFATEPATDRTQVLTCGAILGRSGRRMVLHLSQSRGRLKTRIPLLESLLRRQIPTSPKLEPMLVTLAPTTSRTAIQGPQQGGRSTLNFGIQVNSRRRRWRPN